MYKNLQKISTLFLASVLLFGCSKSDGDVAAKTNYFTLGSQEYDLNKGFLENYGVDGDGFNIDLTLYSSSLSIVEEDGEFFDFEGIGNAMYFEIFTETEGSLADGTYVFNESYDPGTFDIGYVAVDYNSSESTGSEFEVMSGNITVSKDGTSYNIALDLTLDDGQTIVGSFSGLLDYYDYDTFSLAGNASSRLAKPSKKIKLK